VGPAAKTDPVVVCLDADVVIAGLFSRIGASHAVLVLGEVGLLRTVLPEAAIEEVRRHLRRKLPEALALFAVFCESPFVESYAPAPADRKRARHLAHSKDVPIMAAALGARAALLVTHNTKHFRSSDELRVIRPRTLVAEARAWMARFGR